MGRPRKIKEKIEKLSQPIQSLPGMHDILPEDWKWWHFMLEKMISLVKAYGFERIETPILEKTELFSGSIGEFTDIVEKEMFTFKDKSGESLTLRPEATASIVRAYIQHGMISLPQPQKLYCEGPMFRYARPQAGRYRQFHQLNFEIIGEGHPILDAQIIFLCWKIFQELGLSDLEIRINSIGCGNCRAQYKEMLKDFYSLKQQRLCKDCKRRLKINPLRLLDCKQKQCMNLAQGAPQIIDYLCDECHDHFKNVLEYLDELDIPYFLDPHLVRGLDYYTKTTFEIWPASPVSPQEALGGGGRYDSLVEILGGKATCGVGVALGLERIVLELKKQKIEIPERKSDVFLVQLGELAKKKSLGIFDRLQEARFSVSGSLSKGSIKAQLKLADKLGSLVCLIIGQKEALDGTIILRDMESGVQEIIDQKDLIKEVKKRLEKIKKKQGR